MVFQLVVAKNKICLLDYFFEHGRTCLMYDLVSLEEVRQNIKNCIIHRLCALGTSYDVYNGERSDEFKIVVRTFWCSVEDCFTDWLSDPRCFFFWEMLARFWP